MPAGRRASRAQPVFPPSLTGGDAALTASGANDGGGGDGAGKDHSGGGEDAPGDAGIGEQDQSRRKGWWQRLTK